MDACNNDIDLLQNEIKSYKDINPGSGHNLICLERLFIISAAVEPDPKPKIIPSSTSLIAASATICFIWVCKSKMFLT